jgi:hypothetical protein
MMRFLSLRLGPLLGLLYWRSRQRRLGLVLSGQRQLAAQTAPD